VKPWHTAPFIEKVGHRARVCSQPLKDQPVVIVGGGPSLSVEVVKAIAPYNLILTNNAFMVFCDPQVVVAMDRRWWEWHGNNVQAMGHKSICALRPGQHLATKADVAILEKAVDQNHSDDPGIISGKNSGHAAIQMAVHLGANRIYLAGFDMEFTGGRTHWHDGHRIPSSEANYKTRFKPMLEDLTKILDKRNILVAAITHTAADIPKLPLELALKDLAGCEDLQHGSPSDTNPPTDQVPLQTASNG